MPVDDAVKVPEHGGMGRNGADPATYNYVYFDRYVATGADTADEAAFNTAFHAGDLAVDYTLTELDGGARVKLSELWTAKPLVMEFGSFT